MGLSRLVRIVFLGLLLGQTLSAVLTVAAPSLTRGTDGNWAGIYSHKNVLGSLASLQLLCAACLFLQGWNRLLTLGGFCLALVLLVATHSATALVAAAAGLMPLVAIFAWRQGKHVTGFCLGIAIALAGIGILVIAARGADISASLLSDLGKDTTLTGRTILWQFGLEQFWREPLIGIGYKAYWESPLTTAAYLHFVTKQKLWFFHNNFIDAAVAFGIVGVVLFHGRAARHGAPRHRSFRALIRIHGGLADPVHQPAVRPRLFRVSAPRQSRPPPTPARRAPAGGSVAECR
ncbi:O-antigen ligase family protein [Methylobacterium oryzae CBMB20]